MKLKVTPNAEMNLLVERLSMHGISDMQKIDFCLFVFSICLRPQLYVGHKDLRLATTFLDGYDYALDRETGNSRSWGMANFGFWLGPRLGHSTSFHWQHMFVKSFPDESEAFTQLPLLYEQFLLHVAKQSLPSQ